MELETRVLQTCDEGWQGFDIGTLHALPELRARGSDAQEVEPWRNDAYYVFQLPTHEESEVLRISPDDRVILCQSWLFEKLTLAAGDLTVAPPIQNRMFQEISNGCGYFINCARIANTPTPLSYAELLFFIIAIFAMMLPIYIATFTRSYIFGPILTFLIFYCMVCINEVAKMLDNPFGQDVEDIPLVDLHRRFLRTMERTRAALVQDEEQVEEQDEEHVEERGEDHAQDSPERLAIHLPEATKQDTTPLGEHPVRAAGIQWDRPQVSLRPERTPSESGWRSRMPEGFGPCSSPPLKPSSTQPVQVQLALPKTWSVSATGCRSLNVGQQHAASAPFRMPFISHQEAQQDFNEVSTSGNALAKEDRRSA
jgi:hypothetical protein